MVNPEAPVIHVVQSVEMSKNGLLTVQGTIKSDELIDNTIQLMVKKRKSHTYFLFPITWLSKDCWEATINFNDFDFSNGTWDYYLLYQNEHKYRLKIDDKCIFDWDRKALFNSENMSHELVCYITEKDSLSSTIYMPIIGFNLLRSSVSAAETIQLIGRTADSDLLGSASDTKLLIQQRGGHKTYEAPLQLNPEDTTVLTFNYRDILPEKLEPMRWDIYLKAELSGTYYLFRVHLENEPNLEKQTCVELYGDEVYQTYLYSTINGNLSINLVTLTMKRNVVSYSIENHHIHFKGYAYFDLMTFDDPNKLKRYIKVKKRQTNEELLFPIDNEMLNELEIEPDYRSAGFDARIPLNQIFSMQENPTGIYDFSICLIYHNQTYEQRLVCKEYEYIVDEPLATDSLKHRLSGIRAFLLFTPAGYLKLETYTYSLGKLKYMSYRKTHPLKDAKDIWLIGERPDTAQDTGYHFFKYCRENHPEIKAYYVISADSPDKKNLKGLGNVVTFGSWKHFRLAAAADIFIGSHDLEYILPTKAVDWPNYQKSERVFLQHGVLGRKKVDYYKHYYRYPFSLFCVSSKPEFNLVTKKMGYETNEVTITGLSRFDRLMEQRNEQRSILLIPTWRDWIKDETFTDSEYFQKYKALLHDSRLNGLLEKHQVKLDFYVHYRMQPYIRYFEDTPSDYINIIKFGEEDVQDLLIRSKLLITDYSSVSFDFNYMAKPVLFYHFDFSRFFKHGLLRPADKTFLGEICTDKKTLVDSIEQAIENGFNESEALKRKKRSIFKHIDNKNNERILTSIRNNGKY